METLQGTATNCQHTLQISGGGGNNQTSASTTYIALFRVNERAVEFRTNRPSSVSDGDQVKVAGVPSRTGGLWVYACRNLTTGEVTSSGVLGGIFAVFLLPVVAAVFAFVASRFLGQAGFYGVMFLLACAEFYIVRQVVLTFQAKSLVQS